MDFTHYSMTRVVVFTVNTQNVLLTELFAVDVTIGSMGNMESLRGDSSGSFVQVVSVVSLVSHARDEFESLDFLVGDLWLVVGIVRVNHRMIEVEALIKSTQGLDPSKNRGSTDKAEINVSVVRQRSRKSTRIFRHP